MLGGQRQLLNGPAVVIEAPEISATQLEWASQQPGVFETRVIDSHHGESLVLSGWFIFSEYQVIPELSPQFKAMMLPGFDPIRNRCWDLLAIISASQRTHNVAILSRTTSFVVWQEIAPGGEVLGQTQDKTSELSLIESLKLETGIQDGHFISSQILGYLLQQFGLAACFRRVFQIHSNQVCEQGHALLINLTYSPNHAKYNGRKCFVGFGMIVFTLQPFQGRSPVGGDVHCFGVVASML